MLLHHCCHSPQCSPWLTSAGLQCPEQRLGEPSVDLQRPIPCIGGLIQELPPVMEARGGFCGPPEVRSMHQRPLAGLRCPEQRLGEASVGLWRSVLCIGGLVQATATQNRGQGGFCGPPKVCSTSWRPYPGLCHLNGDWAMWL